MDGSGNSQEHYNIESIIITHKNQHKLVMSRIDDLIKKISGLNEFGTSMQAKDAILKFAEEVHNEAVSATVIAENRKHAGKHYQLPKFEDK